MSQFRTPQGTPTPISAQQTKDYHMAQALGETAIPSREDPTAASDQKPAYDEVGRPITVFHRVLRWFRKIFKGY
jgi:hypothetical protein